MTHTLSLRILSVTLLILTGICSATPVVLFEDGQENNSDQQFNRTWQTTVVDYDGNGTNDQIGMIVFTDAQELCSPSANYSGQPFYGGWQRIYYNQTNVASGFINKISPSNQYNPYDLINLRSMQSSAGNTEQYGCYIWHKDDFLNNGDAVPVNLDPTNSITFLYSAQSFGGTWIRYIVKLGGQYYISEEKDNYSGATNEWVQYGLDDDFFSGYFAPYDPSINLYFDDTSAVFDWYPLDDIQAVGIYMYRPDTGPDWTPNLHWRIRTVTVDGNIVTSSSPEIAVSSSTLDFGIANPGETNYMPLTIRNVGGGTLNGSITGISPPFAVISNGTYSLGANDELTTVLAFIPTDTSPQTNVITCTGGGDATVTLLGNIPPATPYIVEFNGNEMVSGDINFAPGWQVITGSFGKGAAIDEKATVPYIPGSPLASHTPGTYSGQTLYGGVERIYFDVTAATGSALVAKLTAGTQKGINLMMYAGKPSETRAVSLFFVKKEDFLNNGDVLQVDLTEDTGFRAALANQLYAGGDVRFVIQIGEQFYMSGTQFNFDYDLNEYVFDNPTLSQWAPYNPGNDLYFNPSGASFNFITLTNITAAGVYCDREIDAVEQHNFMWKTREFYVTGDIQAEPDPLISVSQDTLDYGMCTPGTTNYLSFTVGNIGGGSLSGTVTGISAPFSVTKNDSYNLPYGSNVSVEIAFIPTDTNPVTQVITCTGGGDADITLKGNVPSATPAVVSFIGGSLISGDINFYPGWHITTGDFNNDLLTDEKVAIPFNADVPIASNTPGLYTGQDVYGGMERIYYGVTGATGDQMIAKLGGSTEKGAIVAMSSSITCATRMVSFVFMKKKDFYYDGDIMPVDLTADNSFRALINNVLFAGGDIRFVAQIGGQFYISQQTYDFNYQLNQYTLADPTTTMWGPYNPASNLYFNASTVPFAYRDLTNVTALGVYMSRDVSTPEDTPYNFLWKLSEFEVTGTLVPEPVLGLLFAPILFFLLRRKF